MFVKITIVGLHDFTISPHQNVQNRTRIIKMVRSYKIIGSYGILPILPKYQFLVFFFFLWDKFLVLMML